MIPNIKVLGVGGGGCNAVNRMVAKKVEGFEFIALNTDEKSLEKNLANTKIVMGRNCCSRKGAKGNPKFGQMAANESKDEIATALRGADVVLIVAGLGGGTGTGATPEVARIAREIGIPLTAILATTPFEFEGISRKEQAIQCVEELRNAADLVVIFPNEALNKMGRTFTDFFEAFRLVDDYALRFLGLLIESVRDGGGLGKTFDELKAVFPPGCELWLNDERFATGTR